MISELILVDTHKQSILLMGDQHFIVGESNRYEMQAIN